jgi:hypothetical protein
MKINNINAIVAYRETKTMVAKHPHEGDDIDTQTSMAKHPPEWSPKQRPYYGKASATGTRSRQQSICGDRRMLAAKNLLGKRPTITKHLPREAR